MINDYALATATETPVVRRTSFPSTVVEDRSRTHDVFMLKIASRWHAINRWKWTTAASSSEDSGLSNDTERIFVRWTLLASRMKHRPHALLMARG